VPFWNSNVIATHQRMDNTAGERSFLQFFTEIRGLSPTLALPVA
jgi:hypothetical protein